MTKTILFLAANPIITDRLRLGTEVREIEEGIRRAKQRDNFILQQRHALRTDDLRRAMLDYDPEIVHFSGHAVGGSGIILEDDSGNSKLVSTEALQEFFRLFPKVECVLLNACYSEIQANAIAENVEYVIGVQQQIGDEAAIKFAVGFYDALGIGRGFEEAFQFGSNAIKMLNVADNPTPILIKKNNFNTARQTVYSLPTYKSKKFAKKTMSVSEVISILKIVVIAIIALGLLWGGSLIEDRLRSTSSSAKQVQTLGSNDNVQTIAVDEGEIGHMLFSEEVLSISVLKQPHPWNMDHYASAIEVTISTQRENSHVILKPGDCTLIDTYSVNLVNLEPFAPHTGTFLVTKLISGAKIENCYIQPTATGIPK